MPSPLTALVRTISVVPPHSTGLSPASASWLSVWLLLPLIPLQACLKTEGMRMSGRSLLTVIVLGLQLLGLVGPPAGAPVVIYLWESPAWR